VITALPMRTHLMPADLGAVFLSAVMVLSTSYAMRLVMTETPPMVMVAPLVVSLSVVMDELILVKFVMPDLLTPTRSLAVADSTVNFPFVVTVSWMLVSSVMMVPLMISMPPTLADLLAPFRTVVMVSSITCLESFVIKVLVTR
jgi:hypothetical protein